MKTAEHAKEQKNTDAANAIEKSQPETLRILIQAGAFRGPDKARELLEELRKKGYDKPFIRVDGWYIRVFAGVFAQDQAEKVLADLMKEGYTAKVVN